MAKKKHRDSQFVTYAKMAHQLAQQEFEPYSNPKSPYKFTQPHLVACLMLRHRLNLCYRDMEDWLLGGDAMVKALGLSDVPAV